MDFVVSKNKQTFVLCLRKFSSVLTMFWIMKNLTIRLRVHRVSSSESLWGFPSIVALFPLHSCLRTFRQHGATVLPKPQASATEELIKHTRISLLCISVYFCFYNIRISGGFHLDTSLRRLHLS